MLLTFVGVYDVAQCKDHSKSIHAIVDTFNKHMGGIDKSYQILYNFVSRSKKIITVSKETSV